jgi:hypothetical protein
MSVALGAAADGAAPKARNSQGTLSARAVGATSSQENLLISTGAGRAGRGSGGGQGRGLAVVLAAVDGWAGCPKG